MFVGSKAFERIPVLFTLSFGVQHHPAVVFSVNILKPLVEEHYLHPMQLDIYKLPDSTDSLAPHKVFILDPDGAFLERLGFGTSNSFRIPACCVYRAVADHLYLRTFPAHLSTSTRSGMQMCSQLVLWHLQAAWKVKHSGSVLKIPLTFPQNQSLTKIQMNINFLCFMIEP